MAEKNDNMGRPSIWSKELGKGVPLNSRVPEPIRELFYSEPTKLLLDGMAMDEEIKRKADQLSDEWKAKKEQR